MERLELDCDITHCFFPFETLKTKSPIIQSVTGTYRKSSVDSVNPKYHLVLSLRYFECPALGRQHLYPKLHI